MMSSIGRFILSLSVLMLTGCQTRKHAKGYAPIHVTATKTTPQQPLTPTKHVMVVFVHGTLFPIPTYNGISDLFLNRKKNLYETYMDLTRMESFHKYMPIGTYGLKPVTPQADCSIGTHWAEQAFTAAFRCVNQYAGAAIYFYTFGWSGALNKKTRLKYGQQLYTELTTEVATLLKQKNIARSNLEVIVMAHSHGGNVALNMATDATPSDLPLVDKLILLGTPIQKETAMLVEKPIFKRVYNVYSRGDSIQTLDFFSTNGSSKRRFDDTANKKLIQINIAIDHSLPGHIELYFFNGAKNLLYRGSLAIDPLPVFVFMPFMFQKNVEDLFGQASNLRLHIKSTANDFRLLLSEQKKDSPPPVTIATIAKDDLCVGEIANECRLH